MWTVAGSQYSSYFLLSPTAPNLANKGMLVKENRIWTHIFLFDLKSLLNVCLALSKWFNLSESRFRIRVRIRVHVRFRVGVRVRVRVRVREVIKPLPLSRYPLAREGILFGGPAMFLCKVDLFIFIALQDSTVTATVFIFLLLY